MCLKNSYVGCVILFQYKYIKDFIQDASIHNLTNYTHTPIRTFLIYHIFKVRFPVSFIVMRNEKIVEICGNPLYRIILLPHSKMNEENERKTVEYV